MTGVETFLLTGAMGFTSSWAVAAITSIVVNLAIATVLGKILAPDVPKDSRGNRAYTTTVRNPILPRRVIYGEAVTGGPYIYLGTGSSSFGDDKENELLYQIVALTGHPVEDVVGIFVGDEYLDISGSDPAAVDLDANYFAVGERFSATEAAGAIKIIKINGWGYADHDYVTDETQAWSVQDRTRAGLISSDTNTTRWNAGSTGSSRDTGTGLWTRNIPTDKFHKVTNCAHIYTRLEALPDVWSGIPRTKYHVKGKRLYNPALDPTLAAYGADSGGTHDINDPDTWEYSDDWTLCVLDYLINTDYGLGAKADPANPENTLLNEIDWEEAITSYNISSQLVSTIVSPNTEPRYTINGVFDVGGTPISIMETLLSAGAGELIYSQGFYKIRPGIYRAPAAESDIINENMIVSALSFQTHTPRANLFNKAAGVYVRKLEVPTLAPNAGNNRYLFEASDFPIVSPIDSSGLNPYELEDGEEIIQDFDYPFTISSATAQRLARIQLERVRRGLTVSFEADLEVLKYSAGDTVYLEILDNPAYIGEPFEDRLGLNDTVQLQDSPKTSPYYKQFKILSMEYTENFTIAVTLLEESQEIYEWNYGYANPDENALVSNLYVDDPVGTVLAPTFVVSSPYTTTVSTTVGTDIRTEIRWSPAFRATPEDNAVDARHIQGYRLEYGIVDNPSEASAVNRVSAWIPGGYFSVEDKGLTTQGPIGLNNLYIDPNTDYDFRIRAIATDGRRSVWSYYSVQIGSDFTPTVPYGASRYYLLPTNGTTIHNSTGTVTLEARVVTSAGDNLLSSGTIRLYEGETPYNEITVANGYATPSDGFTGVFNAGDINTSKIVVLSDGAPPGGTILDSVQLIDVSDGTQGDQGADAYTVILTNEAHSLPTTNAPVVDYTGSGTQILVYKGSTQLNSIDSAGTPTTDEFDVTAAVTTGTVTVGAITVAGLPAVVADHSNMTTDQATITYTINIENLVTVTKVQSLAKSFEGPTGADGKVGWGHDLVFSATDADTVAWSAGSIWTAGGDTFSISAGNTGNMTARTYIYYDSDSPSGMYTTTSAQTAVGQNKILVAVAEDTTDAEAFFQVFGGYGGLLITGNEVVANSITANSIAASFYTGRNFTGGIFQTRTPSLTSPYAGVARAVIQQSAPQIAIYSNDGSNPDVEIFGVTELGTGEAEVRIVGDFAAGSLDTAQMFSSAGITDLRGRLGVTTPSTPTGGITTLTNIPQNLATAQTDYELDVGIYETGLDVNTFTFTIYDYDLRSGDVDNPYTAPSWDVNFFYSTGSPHTWVQVPGADYTITGYTDNQFDPEQSPKYINSFNLNATRTVNWTPASPFVATDTIYYMIRVKKNSGDSNIPKLTACSVSEPVSGGTIQNINDLGDVNISSPSAGQVLIYNSGTTDWENKSFSSDITVTEAGVVTIAADAVTYSKIQNVAADDRILGNVAGAGQPVTELDAATVRTMLNVADGANNYSLPQATSTVRGGIEIFSDTVQATAANAVTSTASRTYGIQLNADNQAVVNVPWTTGSIPISTWDTEGYMQYTVTTGSVTTTGWYTIATDPSGLDITVAPTGVGGSRAEGHFIIQDITSGQHGFCEFKVSCHYGRRPTITILNRGGYGGANNPISGIRIIKNSTYDGTAIQVRAGQTGTLYVKMRTTQQTAGLTLKTPTSETPNGGFQIHTMDLTTGADNYSFAVGSGGLTGTQELPGLRVSDVGIDVIGTDGIKSWDTGFTDYIQLYHNDINGYIETNAGGIYMSPFSGVTTFYKNGSPGVVRIYDGTGADYTEVVHNGSYGYIQTNAVTGGNLYFYAQTALGAWCATNGDFYFQNAAIITTNNDFLYGRDTGATTRSIIGITSVNDVQIGDASLSEIVMLNQVKMLEKSAAGADSTNYGQIWVKNDAEQSLKFTPENGFDYPVGYGSYRRSAITTLDNKNVSINMGSNEASAVRMINGCWWSDNATTYTLTIESTFTTNFPIGAQISIWNIGTVSLIIAENTSTTIDILDGATITAVTGGSCTIGVGGYATLIRLQTNKYLLMGAGITP